MKAANSAHNARRPATERPNDATTRSVSPGRCSGFSSGPADDMRTRSSAMSIAPSPACVAVPGVAPYAAGVTDNPACLSDVALPVARLRVILADQSAQRGAHLLVRGGL